MGLVVGLTLGILLIFIGHEITKPIIIGEVIRDTGIVVIVAVIIGGVLEWFARMRLFGRHP